MTASLLQLEDVVHSARGTILTVRHGDAVREVLLDALGAQAAHRGLEALRSAMAAGESLDAAIRSLRLGDEAHRTERRPGPNGSLLLDDTAARSPEEVRASLRVLVDLGREGRRTLAVIGPLEADARERFEAHDSLGRIVVRLDIAQLVVIGHEARHLHLAAGLEGSWNGESVLMEDARSAYDFVRATSGPETVILLTGGADPALIELAALLREEPA